MHLNFNDSLDLNALNAPSQLPWILSENYLKPLRNLFKGRNYAVINPRQNLYSRSVSSSKNLEVTLKGNVTRPASKKEFLFKLFQKMITTAILISYTSAIIFPILASALIGVTAAPVIISATLLGLVPLVAALSISQAYRKIYRFNLRSERADYSAPSYRAPVRQNPPCYHVNSSSYSSAKQPERPAVQPVISNPLLQKQERSGEISGYNEIKEKLAVQIEEDKRYEEVFCCGISANEYSLQGNDSPVFLISDGGNIASKQIAENWKKQCGTKPTSLTGGPLENFNFCSNPGHISQMRLNTENEFYFVDPITNAKLGSDQFKQPYFCSDGYTYDLETFKAYVAEQKQNNRNCRTIASPGNPNISLRLDSLVLYPNTAFYKFAGMNIPKYESVKVE